uniref:SAM pointed domain-containing Ets transcription factor isoform X2 n=1 Tax=Myxine glutinosa TaxID=7769 RepID=UPI00358EB15D
MEDIKRSSNQFQFSRHPRKEHHVEDSGEQPPTLLAGKILYEKAVEAALHQEFSYWRSQCHPEGNVDESSMIHALKTAGLRSAYCSSRASSGTVRQDALASAVETRPPGDGFVFHERCLMEQVHSMVLQEVVKDIEMACNVLNISPDPLSWDTRDASKWIFWTEHQYHLPPLGEAFAGLDGRALNSLSEEQFCEMAIGSSGPILHAQMEIWRTVLHLSLSKHVSSLKGCCSDTQTICQGKAYPASQPIHLWQFLRELLLRPEMYSHLIRWLNQEKGIFKIEDSAQVARLWGERKNRPAMNYDKLSRSIRQYYKKGIIRKTRISQRLVYQFVCPRR